MTTEMLGNLKQLLIGENKTKQWYIINIYIIYVYVMSPLQGIYPISPHQARGRGEYISVPSDGVII